MSSSIQQLRRSRLRILPGSILLGNLNPTTNEEPPAPPLEPPPEPPSEPPPDPTEIVRLVVLGDRRVGKSSVVQKFVTRRYCNPNQDGGDADADNKSVRSGRSHKSTRSSRSHRSRRSEKSHRLHRDHDRDGRHQKSSTLSSRHQMSPDGSAWSADSRTRRREKGEDGDGSGGIKLLKAEYHKKDIAMWLSHASTACDNASKGTAKRSALRRVSGYHSLSYGTNDDNHNQLDKAKEKGKQVCARVQVWDATGQDVVASVDADTADAQDKRKKGDIISSDSKWSQIFRNAAAAVIVCTLGDDENDADITNGQQLDRQLIMEKLERRISRWLALVDAFSSPASVVASKADNRDEAEAQQRIPVTIILNKSDQISNVLSSSDWVRVGAQMERLCERLGIGGGWYTSSCLLPGSAADVAQDSSISSAGSGSWNEDHDGAEMAFLSLVRSDLLAKRESRDADTHVARSDKNANDNRTEGKSPRRKSKGHGKGDRKSSSRRARSRSRSRAKGAPDFPIDP